MAIEGYITVNRMFQDTIVVNHLFEEELQIQRSELFDEFDSIRELFRLYSEQDPSESLPLAAVVFFVLCCRCHREKFKMVNIEEQCQSQILKRMIDVDYQAW